MKNFELGEVSPSGELTGLLSALSDLSKLEVSGSIALEVVDLVAEVESKLKATGKAKANLIEAFCLKNEDGKPVIKDNEYQFESEEKKAELLTQIQTLMNLDIVLNNSLSREGLKKLTVIKPILMIRLSEVISK